jgi:hypothetical protein
VALLAGCGAGYDREDAVSRFRGLNPEVTADQAGCVVDRLVERFGLDRLESDLGADPPDADFEEAQFTDMFRCGVQGDVRQQIADQLVASGVAEADAPCVADELVATMTDADVDVLLSGDITTAFAQKFEVAMAACGAGP